MGKEKYTGKYQEPEIKVIELGLTRAVLLTSGGTENYENGDTDSWYYIS